jgi:integrase
MRNNLEDATVEEWLSSQKLSTRTTYRAYWKHFHEFAGLTGSEILENRKADKNFSWERKVIEFKNWMAEKGYATYTATAATMAVRSFFEFHRCHLEFRSQESSKIAKRTRVTEDYRFGLEDLRKMFEVADLKEKYVLTAGKSFGLRAGDFLRLARGDLDPYIDKGEPPISIGSYRTQKEGIVAYPFIDSDALEVIRLRIDQMTREGHIKATDKMLPYGYEVQLSRVIKRLVIRAGINVGVKEIRFHCMRKFLIDRLSSFMSESKWKQIVGKSISESAYVSPDSLREDYKRATAETAFKKTAEIEGRLAELEKFKAGLTPEQRETARRAGIIMRKKGQARVPEEVEECANGKNCGEEFKQVKEAGLLEELKAGWQIAYKLENGEVIVKR